MYRIIYIAIVSFLLSSCFDKGLNEGTNEVLLNGSILKGVVSNGRLTLANQQGDVIWRDVSDQYGRFESPFSPFNQHLFILTAKSVLDGDITCDASFCQVPTSPPKRYTFGQLIPGAEIGDITLRSVIYLNDKRYDSRQRNVYSQVNGFSTLLVNFIANRLPEVDSGDYFVALTEAGSGVILASLGLDVDGDVNILDLVLQDITDVSGLDNENSLAIILALLNGSMSKNLSFLANFSDALTGYSLSMDDELMQEQLKGYQQVLITEAIALIVNGKVKVNDNHVLKTLQKAKDKGIDFSRLNKRIHDYFVLVGEWPSEFTASSTGWSANIFTEAGHWWWVSEFDRNAAEWLQLGYPEAFIATQVELGLSNAYPIHAARIQGSNDGLSWFDLADVTTDPLAPDNGLYLQHIHLSLNTAEAYSRYRFLAGPSEAVLLAYFCVYQTTPNDNSKRCEFSEKSISSLASSYRFSAENVNKVEADTWWVSELASGNDEWLMIRYKKPFTAKQASLVVKQRGQGVAPKIQGSHDGVSWKTLASISRDSYPDEYIDENNVRHFNIALKNPEAFLFYRYYSEVSAFLLISEFIVNK